MNQEENIIEQTVEQKKEEINDTTNEQPTMSEEERKRAYLENFQHKIIDFEFEDTEYLVDLEARNINVINLPDGRDLHVGGWLDLDPPFPLKITVLDPAQYNYRYKKVAASIKTKSIKTNTQAISTQTISETVVTGK